MSKTTEKTKIADGLKMPPQNIEAERSVLGALMLDKDAIIKVANLIRIGDFYKDDHNIIYEAMVELYEKREPIDVLSLSNRLEEKGKLDQVGGSSYLAALVSSVPSSSNIAHYAKVVQKKSTLRKLIMAASEITELGYKEEEDVEKILDTAEQKLFSVSQKYIKQDFIPIKSILEDAFNRIDELHKGDHKLRGVPTGYPDLDAVLAGFQKSDLVILAARPSIGKTTLALDFARQIATKEKVAVGIFSLEMSADQLIDRMLAAESGVDLWRLRTGRLKTGQGDDDFQRIGEAMGVLSEAPIYIDDAGSNGVMAMRTMARRLQNETGNLGLIIIDYLQLMQSDRSKKSSYSDNRVQEIGEITRSLKALAKELNVPIIAISQLSRAVESRDGQKPRLSDLRESGSIEQDADVVLLIYRESRVKETEENRNTADIIIAKHRNGPIGTIKLFFRGERASFENLTNQFPGYDEYINSMDYKDLTSY